MPEEFGAAEKHTLTQHTTHSVALHWVAASLSSPVFERVGVFIQLYTSDFRCD